MRSAIRDISRYLIALVLIGVCVRSAEAKILFYDNFNGPVLGPPWTASLPTTWQRTPRTSGIASYLGAPDFSFETVDVVSAIQLANVLGDASRVGWSSQAIDTPETPMICEARFKTPEFGPTTSIDGFMELWLLDATDDTRYDKVSLVTPEYGSGRIFDAVSSVSKYGFDSSSRFTFASNTWYRMVLTGSMTQGVKAAIWDDSGANKVLIAFNLRHTLSAYPSGFRVGISQMMGAPGGNYPTDVAIDYVLVTAGSK